MAQNGAVIVFCSSCKILYFASSVHPKIATDLRLKHEELRFHGNEKPKMRRCIGQYPILKHIKVALKVQRGLGPKADFSAVH